MIAYRTAEPCDFDAIRALLVANGWDRRVEDAERFRLMVENASRTIVAVSDERIIGFARALTDEVSNGYIGTVVVAEGRRGEGVGREMVKRLMGDDPNITWVLRAGHESREFWEKAGFAPSSVAMERNRAG